MINSIVGVLVRFRKDEVAVLAVIEHISYSFIVEEKYINVLRFLWYQDNDPYKRLVEYRMCKHVFGNCPSPAAIATYGLRKSVQKSDADVHGFVMKDFYANDGLTSQPTVSKAVDLLLRTQSDLRADGLRLHKVASNSAEVMKAFPSDDLAKYIKDMDLDAGDLPTQ